MATVLLLPCSTLSRSEINPQDFISTEEKGRQSNEKKTNSIGCSPVSYIIVTVYWYFHSKNKRDIP